MGRLSDAAKMIAASLRSIAYPCSRPGLRPDFMLGFTERASGRGSRQQTRAGFSRDFGPPCSAGCLSASLAVASLGPAPLCCGRNPRRSAHQQRSKEHAKAELCQNAGICGSCAASSIRTSDAKIIASPTDWAVCLIASGQNLTLGSGAVSPLGVGRRPNSPALRRRVCARSGPSSRYYGTTCVGPIPVRQLSRTSLLKQTFRSAGVMSGSDPMRAFCSGFSTLDSRRSTERAILPRQTPMMSDKVRQIMS